MKTIMLTILMGTLLTHPTFWEDDKELHTSMEEGVKTQFTSPTGFSTPSGQGTPMEGSWVGTIGPRYFQLPRGYADA